MRGRTASLGEADVAVVGAGPAGLMAALAAASAGARVVVCEKLDRAGVKLAATGGGRCNVTNATPPDEFMRRFGREGHLAGPALAILGPAGLRRFLDEIGVPTEVTEGGRVFPASGSASGVRDAVVAECGRLGVSLLLGARVKSLSLVSTVCENVLSSRILTKSEYG